MKNKDQSPQATQRATPQHRDALRKASIGLIGLVVSIPLLIFGWVFIEFGGLKSNEAKKNMQPLVSQLQRDGGVKICDGGHNGYGLDEEGARYSIYLKMPLSAQLTSEVKTVAAQFGYPLTNNSPTLPYGIQSSRESEYFSSSNATNNRLEVAIYRNMDVPLYCGKSYDGSKKITADSNAVVYFSLDLPHAN